MARLLDASRDDIESVKSPDRAQLRCVPIGRDSSEANRGQRPDETTRCGAVAGKSSEALPLRERRECGAPVASCGSSSDFVTAPSPTNSSGSLVAGGLRW